MLKRYCKFILNIFLVVWALSACTNDQLVEEGILTDTNFCLTLNCSKLSSRATSEGVTEFNENKIVRLDCYFYKKNATNQEQATYHLTVEKLNKEKTATITAKVPDDVLNKLFGANDTQCKVYVVANYNTLSSNTSIEDLKKREIESNFKSDKKQDFFIMDSSGNDLITYDKTIKKLSGEIDLKRAAAKIMLNITKVEDKVTENNVTWVPNKKDMQVFLRQGINRSHIDNTISPYNIQTKDYFDCAYDTPIKYPANPNANNTYEQTVPFYSYPSNWKNKTNKEAYLILVVPWKKEGEADTYFRNCYYQIPINVQGKELNRNNFYKINLSVGILGSFEPLEPIELNPSYTILDWSTETISVDMEDFRYLVVEQNVVTIYNENSVDIPYATSHNVEIVDIKCSKKDLSEPNPTIVEVKKGTTVTLENNTIHYDRTLDNNFNNPTFDFSPYTTTLKIRHIDNPKFVEEIKIIQYPAIYGENDQNSDYQGSQYSKEKNNQHNGYVFVNGYQKDPKNYPYDKFGTANGFNNDEGSPNMYVFTVTSVSNTNYIIGDPRVKEIDQDLINAKKSVVGSSNEAASAWAPAPSVEGKTRKIQSYYPTDESEKTRNVIAPKFRIASAYAVLNTGSPGVDKRETLKKRCASYQEDGFPAGRWRLPTEAEFKFILTMVNKKPKALLPPIYITETNYWCAHGLGKVEKNGTVQMQYITEAGDGYSTRCVYDEWYWGSERIKDKTKFTWGDQPR